MAYGCLVSDCDSDSAPSGSGTYQIAGGSDRGQTHSHVDAVHTSTRMLSRLWTSDTQEEPTEPWTQESLSTFDPREFEYLVAGCWKAVFDAHVRVTRASRDGGVDVAARIPTAATALPGARRTVAIEVKHRSESVSVGVIDRIEGARRRHGAEQAAVVTSGTFTRPARNAAETLSISLFDGEALCRLLESTSITPGVTPPVSQPNSGRRDVPVVDRARIVRARCVQYWHKLFYETPE